jgi:hypothetical protein
MKIMSNCSNDVAAASIPTHLTSLPSTNDYRNLSSKRSVRPLHDAYAATVDGIVHSPSSSMILHHKHSYSFRSDFSRFHYRDRT